METPGTTDVGPLIIARVMRTFDVHGYPPKEKYERLIDYESKNGTRISDAGREYLAECKIELLELISSLSSLVP